MAKSREPFFWSLFSAGGVIAALFLPVMMVLTGIAVPMGWLAAEDLRELIEQPLTRLLLFVVISLSLFHWAHRFRFAAMDLGLRRLGGLLAVLCYGAAILGTLAGGWWLWRL